MSRFLSRAVVAPAPPRPGPGADCLKCKFAVESLHAAVSSPDAITQLIAQADDEGATNAATNAEGGDAVAAKR